MERLPQLGHRNMGVTVTPMLRWARLNFGLQSMLRPKSPPIQTWKAVRIIEALILWKAQISGHQPSSRSRVDKGQAASVI